MATFYSLIYRYWRLLWAAGLLLPLAGQAQAPTWSALASGGPGASTDASLMRATAVDALGNVFVTGNFSGQVAFGSTILTSAGSYDLFVAKYVPSTNSWAWALRGGGRGNDQGISIAVNGSNVYVTGIITNSNTNANAVTFGGTGPTANSVSQYGATVTNGNDVLVAKYVDNGTSAQLAWTQVGGGGSADFGNGIAVSGANVYVTGFLSNDAANTFGVLFGGSGVTAGTSKQYGTSTFSSSDLFVAKYTDNGNSATFGWTQVGGGTGSDSGTGIAVNGSSIYVTGVLNNNMANANMVRFGGSGAVGGTVAQHGASTSSTTSSDVVVAKYTDAGNNASLRWLQVGGGSSADFGQAIEVSGTNVYVVGNLTNNMVNSNGVLFGGSGTIAGTVQVNGASAVAAYDILVAKYIDNGASATLSWTQVGGGTGSDQGYDVALSGASVFVSGTLVNSTANENAVTFGSTGTTLGVATQTGISPSSSGDVLVARYTDQGSSAVLNWTQVGGGPFDEDYGFSIAASNTGVYVGGTAAPTATFGNFTLLNPSGLVVNFLGAFGPIALPTRQSGATAPVELNVYPNPTAGSALLHGATPHSPIHIVDLLGRLLWTTTADAQGGATLVLPAGLPTGLYMVQAGKATTRLSIY
jgi:hypothetical protein